MAITRFVRFRLVFVPFCAAAVAAALTQITTALGTNIAFAGIAEIVYHDAHSGRTRSRAPFVQGDALV